MAILYVIPDTNAFLHFRRPDLLDWPTIVGVDDVCVLLVSPVLRELDQHKNSGRDPVLRQRAQEISEWIRGHLEPAGEERGVEILVREPRAWPPDLDPSVMDDRLIAAALEQRDAGREVAILSDDTLVLAKCIAAGLSSLRPRPQDRRTQDADPQAARIRKLEQELQAERSKRPALRLVWTEDAGPLLVTLQPSKLAGILSPEDLRAKHPKVPLPGQSPEWAAHVAAGRISHSISAYQQYNAFLEDFYKAYFEWSTQETATRELRARMVMLKPLLTNRGTMPASDVRLVLGLPSGTRRLTHNAEAGIPLNPPTPPGELGSQRPHRPAQQITSFSSEKFVPERWPGNTDPAWPTHSSTGREICYVLPKVQHGDALRLQPIVVLLDEPVPEGFAIDASAICDELPVPAISKLVVKLQR